jgi:hypothetical protein
VSLITAPFIGGRFLQNATTNPILPLQNASRLNVDISKKPKPLILFT